MSATLKIAKLIDALSKSGEVISRDDLMKMIGLKNLTTFQNYINEVRQEIGIYTITRPDGFIGYKINYEA